MLSNVFNVEKAVEIFLFIKERCAKCEAWTERAAMIAIESEEREEAIDRFCADINLLCFDKSNGTITPEEDLAAVGFLLLVWPPLGKKELGYD